MSQYLLSSFDSKNYIISGSNKELNSSHPIFWPQRRSLMNQRSSEVIAWSYPPKTNLCAKVFAGISAKFTDFTNNYTNNNNNPFSNQLFNNNSQIDELLSTQILRRMGSNNNNTDVHLDCGLDMSFSDCVFPSSSSSAERTALSDDERVISVDTSVDSDSSNDKTMKICDSKVVESIMQNDRQKKKKRKRRRKKKKSSLNKTSMPCFSMSFSNNDFISIIIDETYDSSPLSSSDEELSCLEMMCKSLFADCIFAPKSNNINGIDEVDCCPKISKEIEEEIEMTSAIEESVKKANEKWGYNYSNVSSDDRISAKVNFSEEKPSVRVLHVWDFASRQARCGEWEQLARDRQRFAERCRRINTNIGYIFDEQHRDKVFRERIFLNQH